MTLLRPAEEYLALRFEPLIEAHLALPPRNPKDDEDDDGQRDDDEDEEDEEEDAEVPPMVREPQPGED
jgi:hypothetical protein